MKHKEKTELENKLIEFGAVRYSNDIWSFGFNDFFEVYYSKNFYTVKKIKRPKQK